MACVLDTRTMITEAMQQQVKGGFLGTADLQW